MEQKVSSFLSLLVGLVALAVAVQSVCGVITVQIGGATRLGSLNRQRERYNCYWDCDLVGCQIARDDDECAYDCEKICRVRYDYAASARSGASDTLEPKSAPDMLAKLAGKSAPADTNSLAAGESNEIAPELIGGK